MEALRLHEFEDRDPLTGEIDKWQFVEKRMTMGDAVSINDTPPGTDRVRIVFGSIIGRTLRNGEAFDHEADYLSIPGEFIDEVINQHQSFRSPTEPGDAPASD